MHPDPGGGRAAWADDGDLWVTDLADAAQHRLTHDGESGVFNGLEDFLAAEELDRFEGAWWSTTGAEIAYAHVDERQVPLFAISPEGLKLTQKGFRKGQELTWQSIVSGESEMRQQLGASVDATGE